MFRLDDKEIKDFENTLLLMNHRALPFATKNTVNRLAFAGRIEWRSEIKDQFIQRNSFTRNSIRVEQARGLDIGKQAAILGSIAPYMEDQEFGGSKAKEGKKGVPLATSYAAGQGMNAQPRTRMPRSANKLRNIRLKHRRPKGTRRQRNLVAVLEAAQSGSKYVYLDLSRRKGIFRVLGGKRKPYVKMVYDLTRQSVHVPATPTLGPAVKKVQPLAAKFYSDSLKFQLKRLGARGF